MHSKTEAQELQATRKAMKEQQMMARQIENEEKKKVRITKKIFSFSVLSNVAITGLHRPWFSSIEVVLLPKIACNAQWYFNEAET
jgi:hypothetical protein